MIYLPRDGKKRRFFSLLWEGVPFDDARTRVGVRPATARQWLHRLECDVARLAGRPVNRIAALRAVFDPVFSIQPNQLDPAQPGGIVEQV